MNESANMVAVRQASAWLINSIGLQIGGAVLYANNSFSYFLLLSVCYLAIIVRYVLFIVQNTARPSTMETNVVLKRKLIRCASSRSS
jgi:hypothetical protein